MDRALLVAYRIGDGRILLDQIRREGLDYLCAFWLFTNDNQKWELNIVSQEVITKGLKDCYWPVIRAVKALPDLRIESSEVTLLEPRRPIAREAVRQLARYPSEKGMWVESTMFGRTYVESMYIYPQTPSNQPAQAAAESRSPI